MTIRRVQDTFSNQPRRSNDHITYESIMREILLELAKTVNLPELNRIGWRALVQENKG